MLLPRCERPSRFQGSVTGPCAYFSSAVSKCEVSSSRLQVLVNAYQFADFVEFHAQNDVFDGLAAYSFKGGCNRRF